MFLSYQNPLNVFSFFLCFTIPSNSIFVLTISIFFFFWSKRDCERLQFLYIYIYCFYLLFPTIPALQGPSLLFSRVQFFFLSLLCNRLVGATLLSLSLSPVSF